MILCLCGPRRETDKVWQCRTPRELAFGTELSEKLLMLESVGLDGLTNCSVAPLADYSIRRFIEQARQVGRTFQPVRNSR